MASRAQASNVRRLLVAVVLFLGPVSQLLFKFGGGGRDACCTGSPAGGFADAAYSL